MRTPWWLLATTLLLGGCALEFRDGRLVEGYWVGDHSWTAEECQPQAFCDRIVQVATQQLLARVPAAEVREVRFHDLPHEGSDGMTVAVTHQTYQVVFAMRDGSERVEHFGCDMHGGLMGGLGSPAYAEFCPPPASGS